MKCQRENIVLFSIHLPSWPTLFNAAEHIDACYTSAQIHNLAVNTAKTAMQRFHHCNEDNAIAPNIPRSGLRP